MNFELNFTVEGMNRFEIEDSIRAHLEGFLSKNSQQLSLVNYTVDATCTPAHIERHSGRVKTWEVEVTVWL